MEYKQGTCTLKTKQEKQWKIKKFTWGENITIATLEKTGKTMKNKDICIGHLIPGKGKKNREK